jgi:hypothetical protein
MKTILLLGFALVALAPARAQVFRPASFQNHGVWRGETRGSFYRGGYGPWWGLGIGAYYLAPRTSIYVADYGSYGYDTGYDGTGYYAQPNYQATGTWLGALAGAIIGRNSGSLGHSAWRGAAYGAGLGLLLGTVADSNVRQRAATAVREPGVPTVAPAAAQAVQPVTIINNYYNTPATPMTSANGLFGRN